MTPELFWWNTSDDKIDSKDSGYILKCSEPVKGDYMKKFKDNYDIKCPNNTIHLSNSTQGSFPVFKQGQIFSRQDSFSFLQRQQSNDQLNTFPSIIPPTDNSVCYKNDFNNSLIKEHLNQKIIRNDTNHLQLSQNEEFMKNNLKLNYSLSEKEENEQINKCKPMKETLFADNSKCKIKRDSSSTSNNTLLITDSKVTENSQLNKNRSMNSGTISSGKQVEYMKQNQGLIVNKLNQNKMSKSTNMIQNNNQTEEKAILFKTNTQAPVMTTVQEEIDSKKNEDDKNSSSYIENLQIQSKITLNKSKTSNLFNESHTNNFNNEDKQIPTFISKIKRRATFHQPTTNHININPQPSKKSMNLTKIKSEEPYLIKKRDYNKTNFETIVQQNKNYHLFSIKPNHLKTPDNSKNRILNSFTALNIPINYSSDKAERCQRYIKPMDYQLENTNYNFAKKSSINFQKNNLSSRLDLDSDFNRMNLTEEPNKEFNLSFVSTDKMQNYRKNSNMMITNKKESKHDNQSKINYNVLESINCSPNPHQKSQIFNKVNSKHNKSENDFEKLLFTNNKSCEKNEFYKYESEKDIAIYDKINVKRSDMK